VSIAIVHEWLATYAGSERVVEQLLDLFPEAELYALVDFLPEEQRGMLRGHKVHTSFLQHLPWAKRRFRGYLPLMPLAIEQFDLSSYDVVVSSNHAVAKGCLTRADQLHVCYVHTPIRYAWDLQHQYLREARLTWGLKSMLVRALLHYLRLWDRASSDNVDVFVANSQFVANRLWKTYRRPAHVIYPPVDTDAFTPGDDREDFYFTASRMVPYKRVDLIVEAFSRMPNKRLVVIGDGPEMNKVAAVAGPNVTLMGYQPHDVLKSYMQRARAMIYAAEEDFGIMPVEAQACGTPVIAYNRGGVAESVVDGVTGLFFAKQSVESLVEAVERFDVRRSDFHTDAIRENAERFSTQRFCREMSTLISRAQEDFSTRTKEYQIPAAESVFGTTREALQVA
jgi:glycosyltransferase involved in cell wall biosynthesis